MKAQDSEAHRELFVRADGIASIWFRVVEGLILLGAIQAAATALESPLLWFLWLISFLAFGIYMLTGAQYALSLALDRFAWSKSAMALKARSLAGFLMAFIITITISELIAEFIKAGLGL